MTVKAKDQVTIIDMTDVQSVVLYHLLQLSTLAAPAKPTVASPNGWSQTEPTYSGDDTKTLYTCIKTIYGDGSFEWGTVNVSSTYAAAKSAYNKAQSALLKLEPDALTTTISTALSGSNAITTTKFIMDKDGLLIKNGGLSIQNNAGVTVLSADSAGNLSITGNLKLLGAQSMAICDNEAVEIGKVYFGINRRQGYDYKCTQILANQALELHAGDINKPADTNQFGACYARGEAMIGWGYDKTTGRRWATLGATDDSSPLLAGVTVDTGSSPKVSIIGCVEEIPLSVLNGYNLNGSWCRYNAAGGFVHLHLQAVRESAGGTVAVAGIASGYRPTSNQKYTAFEAVSGAMQEVQIWTGGQVVLWNNQRSPTYVYMDAIYYI